MLNLDQIEVPAGQAGTILYLPQTTSTMDVAAEQLRENAPHLTTVFAEEQTLGRGRRGRYWHHFKGCNLAFTIVTRQGCIPQLPLLSAIALHRALQPLVKDTISIKWPNDLKLHERKLAGILVEQKPEGMLIGIGVNILKPDTDEIPPDFPGIPLVQGRAKQPPLTRESCMTRILHHFDLVLDKAEKQGWLPFAAEYVKQCETIGQKVTWQGEQQVLTGTALGLDQNGALELKTADGKVHTITAGEIIAQAEA